MCGHSAEANSVLVRFEPVEDYSDYHRYNRVPGRWIVREELYETYNDSSYYDSVPPEEERRWEARNTTKGQDIVHRKMAEDYVHKIRTIESDILRNQ